MKKLTIMLLGVLVLAACEKKVTKSDIHSDMDRASYSIGYDIGESLKATEAEDLNVDLLLLGFMDATNDQEPALTEEQRMMAINYFQQEVRTRQQKKMELEGEANAVLGTNFLAENASRDGVMVTESGLQYRVIEEGSGARPRATDRVTVHYRGTLIDGTEFDSSYKRGEPATFALNQVIPGWTEGLQLMRVGAKYELFIPSDLGYGSRGAGGMIGPNSTLIFEVELLNIES